MSEYQLKIDDNSTLEFKDASSFLDWVEFEIDTWSWLSSGAQKGVSILNKLLGVLPQLSQRLLTVISNPDNQNIIAELNRLISVLETHISKGNYILSSTPLAKYADELKEIDHALACSVINAAITGRAESVGNDRLSQEGFAAYSAFTLGLSKPAALASRKFLMGLSAEYAASISRFDNEAQERTSVLDKVIKQREDKVTQTTTNLARVLSKFKSNTRDEQQELRTKAKDEIDTLVSESKSRIQSFEEFYETKIALLEPVKYWKEKRYWHRWATAVFAILFLAYAGALILTVGKYAFSYEEGFAGFVDEWKSAELGALGVIAIMIGLSLVLARILYRLFASQLHLWNDASERITMTQTYLALAEKGHVKEEFLGALLARLFAPASDGVVKDDFGSIGPLDALITKLGK